jgi:hypothetical protein
VFTRDQAVEAGWSPRQVARRTAGGAWVRVAGAALAGAGWSRTAHGVAWAIHLTWPAAVVAGATAALIHGFPLAARASLDVPACAVLPRGAGRSGTVQVLRDRVADEERVVLDSSVHVTAPARTAVDCLAVLDRDQATELLAWVMTRRIIGREHLAEGIERYRRKGGFAQLRALYDLTGRGALSPAEDLCHEVLDRFGIGGWTANLPITDAHGVIAVADVAFESERVVVEVDGWSSHGDRDAFERDRRRQARLVAAGWVVIRVTWRELRHHPARFAADLRRALDGRRLAVPGRS